MDEAQKHEYWTDLLEKLRDHSRWPSFPRPDWLKELEGIAVRSLNSGTEEGAIAAILLLHQLSEEQLRVLIECSEFYLQVCSLPAPLRLPGGKSKKTFGQRVHQLKASIDFPGKDVFLPKTEEMNKLRNKLVHGLTRKTKASQLHLMAERADKCFGELWEVFDQSYDWFRECFREIKKSHCVTTVASLQLDWQEDQ